MGEQDVVLAVPDFHDRRNLVYLFARAVTILCHRFLTRPHVELNDEILRLKARGSAVFLYAGLHKSLWETNGALVPLYRAGLPVPYVGMGDNLVTGRLFREMAKKVGTFLIERPTRRREMLASARKLRDDIVGFIARGIDVLVFPEGTRKNIPARERYGDFFPTVFEALLHYERNKQQLTAGSGLPLFESYIVPVNVDYSRVREAPEIVGKDASAPRTLHISDSLSLVRHIGDTYISYGEPIRVADRIDLDRKDLAALCRERCMELVKILPINVTSHAMMRFDPGRPVPRSALDEGIRRVVDHLRHYADRFRGFSPASPAGEIVRRAEQAGIGFEHVMPRHVPVYRLYANYIRHYLDAFPAPSG